VPETMVTALMIQEARVRFNRTRHRSDAKSNKSFDWWYIRFKNTRILFAAIGREEGLTRQRVHKIFHNFFASVVPERLLQKS